MAAMQRLPTSLGLVRMGTIGQELSIESPFPGAFCAVAHSCRLLAATRHILLAQRVPSPHDDGQGEFYEHLQKITLTIKGRKMNRIVAACSGFTILWASSSAVWSQTGFGSPFSGFGANNPTGTPSVPSISGQVPQPLQRHLPEGLLQCLGHRLTASSCRVLSTERSAPTNGRRLGWEHADMHCPELPYHAGHGLLHAALARHHQVVKAAVPRQ